MVSFRTALLILLARCFVPSLAQVNITVDDGDLAAIAYTGTWISSSSPLDAGGSHRLGEDDGVLARFTFTGTAIYFMSPLWPYEVFTQLQLDSQPPVQLNLSDPNLAVPSQTGEETVQSEIVWGKADLPNVSHTLQISKAPGRPYAIVDTLIYTIPDSTLPSSSEPPSSSSTTPADSSATSPPVKESSQSSLPVLTIALTTGIGSLGLCLVAVAFWICCRRRQRRKAENWKNNESHPPLATIPPEGPLSPETAHGFKSTSWSGSNFQMATSLAPLPSNPQHLTYQPLEIERDFNPYVHPERAEITHQPPSDLYQRGTLSYAPTSLSTITEKSTLGTGAAGSSPVSLPSTDLSYYTPGSQSIGAGAARLSYASDTSPGVMGGGPGHQHQTQPHLYTNGSIEQLRSPGSFGSLSHEVAKPSKLRNGKNVMVAVNRVEDAGEGSRPPAYTPR
ncbi:hypothetical protein Agabi119p4_4022 [Agaricus bisporus var. burnettii]|uniref:Dystroglycan-type cadherin-like domain-containing protein n=1 Tax=Agaricus bisporus var. burnettii TaxID=192524 RepID=A0A8H7F2S0_AGABI|nr:hypothetical protein Agabi119p4_4022 [Agaricus bisporus var. burnettii]